MKKGVRANRLKGNSARKTVAILLAGTMLCVSFLVMVPKTVNAQPPEWSVDMRLTIRTEDDLYPAIAVNGNNIHVVWYVQHDPDVPSACSVFYMRSRDNGKTWDRGELEPGKGELAWDARNPAIAVNGNNIHVAYERMEREGVWDVFYARSSDNGDTWDFVYKPISKADDFNSQHPDVAVSEDNVHIVWQDEAYAEHAEENWEIYYVRSVDNGNTFQWFTTYDFHMLSFDDGFDSVHPAIALHGGMIHTAWEDCRYFPNTEIYYKRSTSNGFAWDDGLSPPGWWWRIVPDRRLTNDPQRSEHPDIAVWDCDIHVAWHDLRHYAVLPSFCGWEIYYKRSPNDGVNWGADTRLTTVTMLEYYVDSMYPAIAASGNNVHVVWHDYRDGTGFAEIYYKESTSNGASWGWDTQLTYAPLESWYPGIAVHDSKISVVWQDERDENWEVYYKKYIVGSLSATPGPDTPSDHQRHYDPSAPPYNEMLQIALTAGSAEDARINSVTLTASGTGDDSNGIAQVLLVHDVNGNGIYDAGEATLATGTYPSDDGTLALTIASGHVVSAGTTDYLLVVYTINWAAISSGDTFTFGVTAISAMGVNSSQPITVSGLPISACTKTTMWDPWVYDTNHSGFIEIDELLAAINDYIGGEISISQLLEIINLYISHTHR